MVQWLGTLAAPLEDLGLILGIIHSGSQVSVTPGNLTLSAGLHRHQTYVWCTDM